MLGLASNEDAGAGIPWLVAEHDAGIGRPSAVQARSMAEARASDPLRVVGEPFGQAGVGTFLPLRVFPEGVLVNRDEGIGKRRRLAYVERFVIRERTLP